jgi:hypothetical protein
MIVAIHQPNYVPWCGYFAKIKHADAFIFLDDAQMPRKQSYVYRSEVCTHEGVRQWLSVPTHSAYGDPIRDVALVPNNWHVKHLKTLIGLYGRCAKFREVIEVLTPIYETPGPTLADFNIRLIFAVANYLGLQTNLYRSSDLHAQGTSDDRLISLVQIAGGKTYLSGPGGQNYQSEEKFSLAGLALKVRQYRPIAYPQRGTCFTPGLSVLDALFNVGKEAVHLLDYAEPLTAEPKI